MSRLLNIPGHVIPNRLLIDSDENFGSLPDGAQLRFGYTQLDQNWFDFGD